MNGNSPYVNTALAQTSAPTPPTNTITPLSMDPSDAGLRVHVQNGSAVGVGVTDESAFVEGSTKFNGAGGVFNDSLTAISSGLVAWFRMTAYRAVHVNLRNNSGTEIGTLANPIRIDPTGTTPQPVTQSGSWTINIANSNTSLSGQQAVTTGAANLGSNSIKGIRIINNVESTANAYLGPSSVTTSTGYELTPGQYIDLPLTNTNQIYVIATSNSTSVISWLGTN